MKLIPHQRARADEFTGMSLTEAAGAIRRRRISSLELTKACLAWIDRVQPQLNCFISIEREAVLAAARKADRILAARGPLGALHGVPLAHKDMFFRRGKIATCGSKILRDQPQTTTATVVERLEAAGALWLGGLNMGEFASNPTGDNAHFGRCRNPWNLAAVTGGSSSGSAAAVAARACHASLGSDTGGSIRTPAAICGVVGLKPTHGRVSVHGAMPRAWSHDSIGPLARTVRDCARLLSVIAGADPNDPDASREPVPDYERGIGAGIAGVRIGVPTDHFYDDLAPDIRRCMDASLAVLSALGAHIVPIAVPQARAIMPLSVLIAECESSAYHAHWMQTRPQDYAPDVRARFEPGLTVPAVRYIEAQNERKRLTREFTASVMSAVDVLHTPVLPVPVPTIAATEDPDPENLRKLIPMFTRNTRAASFFGLPALSVPAGFSDNAMPVAFQLIGRAFAEALLLRVGHAYQEATDWHTRSPVRADGFRNEGP
ncbi:MAG: amidase [Burkholderiales bacterium]|nr:amidase [Burkholderiales bacterium]